MPTNPNAENANKKAQGTVEDSKRGKEEEGKKDSSEKTQGKESTGNSSKTPGSASNDATAVTLKGAKKHSKVFDSVEAIKQAMEKYDTTGKVR